MKHNAPRTLVIDSWSSRCGECGKGADPEEKSHETVLGYGVSKENKKGCGSKWKYVSTGYMDSETIEGVKAMRPDLIFVQFGEVIN